MKNIYYIVIILTNFLFSEYIDVQFASFSYTIGGSYGSCSDFKKSDYSFSDYSSCSCAWAANSSDYPNCHELYYNPQTKMLKYNTSPGGEYTYRNFSNDYTCHNYVEETEPVYECSEMNQLQCGVDSTCEWVEDVQTGWCGSHNTAASCPDYPVCSWGCDGCYYLGECCGSIICNGGYYQINNSYCEEVSFIAGDSNGDGLLNVNDVVMMIEYILDAQYNQFSDFNQDGVLNVIDVVELVDRILNT